MKKVFILVAIITLLGACKSTKNVPIHDTIYISKYVTDVQVQYDSIYIDRWHTNFVKGDTIILQDSVIIYKYASRSDTLRLTDTAYVTNTEVVEKEVTRNRYPLLPLGIAIIGIGVLLLIAKWYFDNMN